MDQDTHMQLREKEKAQAIADIAAVLDTIAHASRAPDLWERVHLAHALSSVFSGCYNLARTDARLAMTPVNERSLDPGLPTDPTFDKIDMPMLSKALHIAVAEPVRQFPCFGPVVLR